MTNIIHTVLKNVIMTLLRFLNFFIHKEKNHLMFIPSENCRVDKYDILNNGADNVLKLCYSILHDNRFRECHLSIAIYDNSKIQLYHDYCKKIQYKS